MENQYHPILDIMKMYQNPMEYLRREHPTQHKIIMGKTTDEIYNQLIEKDEHE